MLITATKNTLTTAREALPWSRAARLGQVSQLDQFRLVDSITIVLGKVKTARSDSSRVGPSHIESARFDWARTTLSQLDQSRFVAGLNRPGQFRLDSSWIGPSQLKSAWLDLARTTLSQLDEFCFVVGLSRPDQFHLVDASSRIKYYCLRLSNSGSVASSCFRLGQVISSSFILSHVESSRSNLSRLDQVISSRLSLVHFELRWVNSANCV